MLTVCELCMQSMPVHVTHTAIAYVFNVSQGSHHLSHPTCDCYDACTCVDTALLFQLLWQVFCDMLRVYLQMKDGKAWMMM